MTTPARHTARRLALHALKAASLVMALATCLPQAAAQWTPGTEYNAVTLGSGSFFTTDDSYTQAVSSNAASVEVWVNFSASAQADMAIGQVFDNLFNEGIVLYADWNGSTGHDLNMVGVGAFGGDIQTVTNSTTMLPGQWYHIVGEYDANGLACYVDGTATTGNWGGGGGPTANKTFNANTWGSSALTGLPSFEGLTTGFRIWDGNIGAPTEANSAVNASPTYAGTLGANFQVGTNGNTTSLVGSPAGGNLTLTGSTQYAKYGTGTITVTSDSYFLDTIDAGTLQIGDGNTTGALTTDVVNNGTLSFNRSNALTHSNTISGTGSVTKLANNTLTLSGSNSYTGSTTVSAGTLSLTGTLGATATTVGTGAIIEGNGTSAGTIAGAGSVAPGTAAAAEGILTFSSLDPSANTVFNLEFTSSDPNYADVANSNNDIVRLTAANAFDSAMTSANVVNIYLNVDSQVWGDQYRGGFFTDTRSNFLTSLQDATVNYFLKDAGGAVSYNGVDYTDVTSLDWVLQTVPANANFAGGTVNGQVLQVVPEPSSFALAGFAIAGLAAAGYRRRKAGKKAA